MISIQWQNVQTNACNNNMMKKNASMRTSTRTTGRTTRKFTSPWRVENSQLESLPDAYPIERSHIVIQNLPAPVISGRICEFARVHSLAAKWSNGVQKNTIRCTTPEQLVLDTVLWRSKKMNGGIIVEIRRRQGDSYKAHELKCLLFKCLTLKKQRFQEARIQECSIEDRINIIKNQLKSVKPSQSQFSDVMDTIANATQAMCSRSTEEIIAGLRLLDFLTDPRHVNPAITSRVSYIIWAGAGIDPDKNTRLQATDILCNYALDNSNEIVNFWAVRTLGNVFLHLHKRVDLQQQRMGLVWSQIIPTLIENMIDVEINPHISCTSMRCLRALITLHGPVNDERRRLFSDEDKRNLKTNLGRAFVFGHEQNEDIKKEAIKLSKAL
jgi:hypothetical protein